jgi:hypothetical protein
LLKRFGPAMMDSLNIDEFVDLAEILQVIHHVFAIERRS